MNSSALFYWTKTLGFCVFFYNNCIFDPVLEFLKNNNSKLIVGSYI